MSYSNFRGSNTSKSYENDPIHRSLIQKEQKAQKFKPRFVVYIENVITNNLSDDEVEEFIKRSVATSVKSESNEPNRKTVEILSIKVFQNCLYIEFEDESCAKSIAHGLNNQTFKSNKIRAYCLDKLERESDLFTRNKKDVNQFFEKKSHSNKTGSRPTNLSSQSHVDCELVVLDRQLRKYADSIHDKLKTSLFGLNVRITYVNNETLEDDLTQSSNFINERLEDAIQRNMLYLIFINHTNEQYNSMSLYVVNNWQEKSLSKFKANEATIKENKNMPLNRALDFLKLDYYNYISYLKKNIPNHSSMDIESDEDRDSDDESDGERKDKRNGSSTSTKIFKFNKKQKKFLKLLLKPMLNENGRNESIKLNDLDRLLTYLYRQKSNLITATLCTHVKSESQEPEAISTTDKPPSNQNQNQPVPLLSMQINPADVALSTYSHHQQQHQAIQMTQIPSLLSMSYQIPPPLLNQAAGIPPSLLQANLMQPFQLIPNYGLGHSGANAGTMSLLGHYTSGMNSMPNASSSNFNTSTAPPSLMSIQPSQSSSANPAAQATQSLMSVQPSSLMNLSLPNFLNSTHPGLNASLLGNPPQSGAYSNPNKSNNPNSSSNAVNVKQR